MKNTSFLFVLVYFLSLTIAQATVPKSLIETVRSGNASATDTQINALAGPTRNTILNEVLVTEGGMSLLHIAALNGDLDVARVLLEHGADPEIRNSSGQTPRATVQKKTPLDQLLRRAEDAKLVSQVRALLDDDDE